MACTRIVSIMCTVNLGRARSDFVVCTHPFVYYEDMKWGIQGYSFYLLANQPKVATVAVRV